MISKTRAMVRFRHPDLFANFAVYWNCNKYNNQLFRRQGSSVALNLAFTVPLMQEVREVLIGFMVFYRATRSAGLRVFQEHHILFVRPTHTIESE